MKMGTQLRDALKAAGLSPEPRSGAGIHKEGHLASRGRKGGAKPEGRPPSQDVVRAGPVRQALERPPAKAGPHRVPTRLDGPSAEPAAAPAAEANRPSALVRIGTFHPHDLFVEEAVSDARLPAMACDGIEGSLTQQPENETDLVLGIDFGTSTTKVVIRDVYAATSVFPVRLSGQRSGVDAYLLPSRIFRTGAVYSLDGGTHRMSDLKLALLSCKARSPVTEFNDCCAYVALVIRRARGWLFTEHRYIYARHALNWKLNLGIAARSYEDKDVVELFRRLAWAAANLASDPEAIRITTENADLWRQRSLAVASTPDTDQVVARHSWSDVDAVPEVSAQIQGFMTSARWNWQERPIMMLVDVGAGTVDSAMFHVRVPSGGAGVMTFYSSRVQHNGVMNLHRSRVEWLQQLLPHGGEDSVARDYLSDIARATDRLRPIPERVDDYLPGYEIKGENMDDLFRTKRYRGQVAGCINEAKVGKGVGPQQLLQIPLLLCGGGSRMQFYGAIDSAINATREWNVSVDVLKLPVPQDLADSGWHSDDFDRVSVAFGLSLSGEGGRSLGSIVRAIDVPQVQPYRAAAAEDRYVSKDQM